MNITLISTSENKGGAAVACSRLLQALKQYGIPAKMLVQEKKSNDSDVISTTHSKVKHYYNFIRFAWERLVFALWEKSRDVRFAFSLANTGEDISKMTIIQNSDILHLHWINQGFLSLLSIRKLLNLKKPLVWTLHDMWLFTGGCHYAGDCNNFETECHNCPFLKKPGFNDLAYKIFQAKLHLFQQIDLETITFVACSQWLAERAKKSRLLKRFNIISIPNPIDSIAFYPVDKMAARIKAGLPKDKKLILFGAGNIFDKRKGIDYLHQALNSISTQHPELALQIELVVFGKSKQPLDNLFPMKIHNYGVLHGENLLLNLYNSCDAFILPSLEDNLPNTIMESMACGTPVAAFRTGGIPEMIEHLKNGFLADIRSVSSLVEGIIYLLFSDSAKNLRMNARAKTKIEYAPQIIASQYEKVYNRLFEETK